MSPLEFLKGMAKAGYTVTIEVAGDGFIGTIYAGKTIKHLADGKTMYSVASKLMNMRLEEMRKEK